MHPSLSVIFFTTLSGAGYGLLALLGLLAPPGLLPRDPLFALVGLVLALGAITVGLLSSVLHLGHKERAWRAFSQWRSSWLSREGVMAVATYVPAILFGAAWLFLRDVSAALGLLAALGAVATVVCTAMIYRSLKPIPRWHNVWVLPNYLALSLMTGSLWLSVVTLPFTEQAWLSVLAVAATALAALLKLAYWRHIDTAPSVSTAGTATGLDRLGTVRLFEAPHTSENYLLKEMGFEVARKHAARLRSIALGLGFALPALLSLVPLFASGPVSVAAALLAALLAMLGVFVERWLFFAEARHVVTLYYGAATA
ncbi:dimethyl sulfoxide reductase anchor subunit family protein [Reyranella sp.]|uniref:dimethyl sulfoxide reductase anchor subunit family protein n=1 Tax=Reyranella sp. TaxID=1929291 RepID=UPI003BA844A9